MSANIWIDKSHNNLHASSELLSKFLDERTKDAQKSVLEIPEKDFLKQKNSQIEKPLTAQFTIDLITLEKPAPTKPELAGKNYVICQTILFKGDPVLLEYSPVAAGPTPPIDSTKKQTPARGPIGKIIKSKNSSNCGEIEVKLVIKGDIMNQKNTALNIKKILKKNYIEIMEWTDFANQDATQFNKHLPYYISVSIQDRRNSLEMIENVYKQIQDE